MMKSFIFLAAVLASVAQVLACGDTLLSTNFDSHTGPYQAWDKATAQGDFAGLKFVKFFDNAQVGEGNLMVKNPQGCIKTDSCGITFDVGLSKPVTEATLSYKFKFSDGYMFAKGGKLPGLCDEDCPSGCVNPGASSGWSSRCMWREEGSLMSYSYYSNMPMEVNCGDNWPWNRILQAGTWNDLEMYVKLNTPGQNDGLQTMFLNGETVLSRNDIHWRGEDGHDITRFTFRNFHGGSGPEWASPQDQFHWFDDIVVREGDCLGAGASSSPSPPPPSSEPTPEPSTTTTTEPAPEATPAPTPPADATATSETTAVADSGSGDIQAALPGAEERQALIVEENDVPDRQAENEQPNSGRVRKERRRRLIQRNRKKRGSPKN